MAEDNLKDFTIQWVIVGVLLFCLLSFTLGFMYDNNPDGLGTQADSMLDDSKNNMQTKLYEVESDSNSLLNKGLFTE